MTEIAENYEDAYRSPTDGATEAEPGVALSFEPIALADVRPGMTLRLQRDEPSWETVVGTVRTEHFSPIDEALVIDALYRDARVSDAFREGRYKITALIVKEEN